MARLTHVYGCDGCAFMTRNKKDLHFTAKVKDLRGDEHGATVLAHTAECLVEAVALLVKAGTHPHDADAVAD